MAMGQGLLNDPIQQRDAFVAYARDDTEVHAWVSSFLVPTLEQPQHGRRYQLYLMERDTVQGMDIWQVISEAPHQSKCTILIVGSTFCQDMWMSFTLRTVHHYTHYNPQHSLLIVLMNRNVLQLCGQDKLLQAYIDLNKYMMVTQCRFWQKLTDKMNQRPSTATFLQANKCTEMWEIMKMKIFRGLQHRNGQQEAEYMFDAFIAFDDHDANVSQWVLSSMLSNVEDSGYRCFLMCRDAVAGADISDCIHAGIHNSKCTILVVGDTYSFDIPFMFRVARQQLTQGSDHKLIIVLMNENSHQACRQDPLLQAHVSLKQYMLATDARFWGKLLHKMPQVSMRPDAFSDPNILIQPHILAGTN